MEKVATQVATPIFIHQSLSSRFCESPAMAKKRDLSYAASPNFVHQQLQNPSDNWNPKVWDWDTVRFVAKPLDTDMLRLGTPTTTAEDQRLPTVTNFNKNSTVDDDEEEESLRLNLGGCLAFNTVQEPMSRPNKRLRSRSPGGPSYPMCQVDNCKEDLSNAKDYHRRHKVCEVHSKSSKALVANQMQRFCQQCSRFHPLSEFDEGKRSCRRRLAGHNRRRRKTQPEDVTSRLLPGNQDTANTTSSNLDIVDLLTTIARAQGKFVERSKICSQLPQRDQLVQILNRINSLPLPADLAAKLANVGNFCVNVPGQTSSDHHDKLNQNKSSPSTMDFLAVLSATLSASAPDAIALLSQKCSHSSDSEKSRTSGADQTTEPSLQTRQPLEFPSIGAERSSSSYQSPVEDSDCRVQETRINLPLQLFNSSPEDESLLKMPSSQKYLSSDSSNPLEERSPSSSPSLVQKQVALQSVIEGFKSNNIAIGRVVNTHKEAGQRHDCNISLDLFRGSNSKVQPSSMQSVPFQAGYRSSGSDYSPSSFNSDAQDRTGRIMFKLFDKDPSHFPGTLRTQIYNWLSNSPSEMESYIRPGCVILSVYVSMSSATWECLEENFLQHVHSLIQNSDSKFWRNGRFLVHAGSQLASHKDGKIRICKTWRTWRSPELISISPLAIVGGQETSISLKGRNLSTPGTKIHCTNMSCYTSEEVIGSVYSGMTCDEIKLGGFKVHNASPSVFGRCFIEVENGFKGNSFPVIIADATICKELQSLESELDMEVKLCDAIAEEHAYEFPRTGSREEALHFLNELGWLFQRKRSSYALEVPDYSLERFKFLLTFSVERNCLMLVKTLMDMLVEEHLEGEWLSKGSEEMLNAIQLLNRAVKRRFIEMVDLLVHYSIPSKNDASKKYIFPPSVEGPAGITPLHLAACTSGSEGLIDSLTNDPQEIGLKCWESLVDANGQTPYTYATMRNNHSYNMLIARKLADREKDQVSVTIENEIEQPSLRIELKPRSRNEVGQGHRSCAKCVVAAMHYNRRVLGPHRLLNRPYIHSVLAIAAVCVCVCLFFRGAPEIGSVAPFKSGDILEEDLPHALAKTLNEASEEVNDDLGSEAGSCSQHTGLDGALDTIGLEAVNHVLGTHRMEMVVAEGAVVDTPRSSLLALPTRRIAVGGGGGYQF
ncbi:squamosa promoter-binding-like protein 14 [Senna tora]|uniref:Squamosa promoter-binding-like protein 14 n=1 Tax=Senna tora TaxID=362788 RepID=A0A834WN19_9FABA|nr:squamosa promoter-binding-like protein 14 [Senna tora]